MQINWVLGNRCPKTISLKASAGFNTQCRISGCGSDQRLKFALSHFGHFGACGILFMALNLRNSVFDVE
jgi:hypothetical protein